MLDHDRGFGAQPYIVADGREPFGYTGEQLYRTPLCHKIGPVDPYTLGLRHLIHQMHVRYQVVGLVFFGEGIDFGPESSRILADLRQKRVLLHGARAERTVEIVDQGDRVLQAGFGASCRGPTLRDLGIRAVRSGLATWHYAILLVRQSSD